MSVQKDPERPSPPAAHTPSGQETKDPSAQNPCLNRHSDRVLAFLRKHPGRLEGIQ